MRILAQRSRVGILRFHKEKMSFVVEWMLDGFALYALEAIIGKMLHVALLEPEIPPNTGNIARLCAATDSKLHIVGVAGFRLDEKAVRRAGLDYWEHVQITRHIDMDELYDALPDSRFVYLSTKSKQSYFDFVFKDHDCLVLGRETKGLPESLLNQFPESSVRIPMTNPNIRSLNLATSAGIVLYEAIRQTNP